TTRSSSSFPVKRRHRRPRRRISQVRIHPDNAARTSSRLPSRFRGNDHPMPRITSRDNPRLHEAARLIASSRERRKADRCVLEGEHLVEAYVRRIGPPETLIVAEAAQERPEVRSLMSAAPAGRMLIVAASAWSTLGPVPAAAGVLAVIPTPRHRLDRAADFCLLLEDVQD